MKQEHTYLLENKITGEQYVGRTRNVQNRLRHHRRNKPHSKVGRAIAKHGMENFEVVLLH